MNDDIFSFGFDTVDFDEVETAFNKKLPITKEEFQNLSSEYKKRAFTVGNYTNLEIIDKFYSEISKAIENGTTLETFKKSMNEFLEIKGYSPMKDYQARTIFTTNIQTEYNIGHYNEMMEIKDLRPFWRYDAVDDENTRPEHQAMDGKIYEADSPIWEIWYPPNGYNCRCKVVSLSKRQVERKGLKIETEIPKIKPDKGFDKNAAKVSYNMDIDDYPEALKIAYDRISKNKRNDM